MTNTNNNSNQIKKFSSKITVWQSVMALSENFRYKCSCRVVSVT